MIELEQCSFCNGKTEIVTLSCPSGGTPCYCFRCTKCGGIRRFGTLNPVALCRECEQRQRIVALEQAGDRMAKRLCLIINSERTPDNASIDAVKNWWKVKEESK